MSERVVTENWARLRGSQRIFTARKRSLGKVMFSEAFVCSQGGLCMMSLPVQGGSPLSSGFSSVQGVSIQGGLCPGGSFLSRAISSVQGGLCPGGSLSRGLHSGGSLSRETPRTETPMVR